MPAPLLHKNEVLERLLATFRDRSYDAVTLADLAAAAGVSRSRLEAAFPGGKEEIARKVVAHHDAQLTTTVFEPLRSKQAPARKLAAMLQAIDEHYDGGRLASLLGRLAASAERLAFRPALAHGFEVWVDAVAELGVEAGLPPRVARARAEDVRVRLEGALVICAATGDLGVFERALASTRASLLAPHAD